MKLGFGFGVTWMTLAGRPCLLREPPPTPMTQIGDGEPRLWHVHLISGVGVAPAAPGRAGHRRDRNLPNGTWRLRRQAAGATPDLRRPGGDRDRERAPI